MPHNNLYTVDNSAEDRSVKSYLRDWCSVSKQMDIATGYLEIGGLLELDGCWQQLDKIRIILGNEVTRRTEAVINQAVTVLLSRLKSSVDSEQEKTNFSLEYLRFLMRLNQEKSNAGSLIKVSSMQKHILPISVMIIGTSSFSR